MILPEYILRLPAAIGGPVPYPFHPNISGNGIPSSRTLTEVATCVSLPVKLGLMDLLSMIRPKILTRVIATPDPMNPRYCRILHARHVSSTDESKKSAEHASSMYEHNVIRHPCVNPMLASKPLRDDNNLFLGRHRPPQLLVFIASPHCEAALMKTRFHLFTTIVIEKEYSRLVN